MNKNYSFKYDWASAFRKNAEALFLPFKDKPIKYLEIGVFEGRSACWMLDHVLTHPESQAVLVDCRLQDVAWENLRVQSGTDAITSKCSIKQGNSREVLPKMDGYFDLIYIDGDHSAKGVLFDSVNCWNLCKYDGIILWDDYRRARNDGNRVWTGVNNFIDCLNKNDYQILLEQEQFAVRKRKR